MGYVPSAVRCNPYGSKGPSTQFGTWFIDPQAAAQLLADRHAGRPMPWHGKPLQDNLRVTFKLWQARRHPAACKTCADIWGKRGAPASFEDYAKRYPPLAHGAKRHLTLPWTPGLTLDEVAARAGCHRTRVQRAIKSGMLDATRHGRAIYVTKTDASRWIARRRPTGDRAVSWISLATAEKLFLFTRRQLTKFIAAGKLKTKVGDAGAQRGILYVAKDQCARLRASIGFSELEAARRVGVPVARIRELLNGVNWRNSKAIPLVTVQAVIKRRQSRPGYTLEQAAELLGKPVSWIEARQADGTIRVLQTRWDASRVYISGPMMARLRKFTEPSDAAESLSAEWLRVSDAAFEAGVTIGTISKWAESGALQRRESRTGWRYYRQHVREQARLYWKTVRFHRVTPPEWLQAEQAVAA
jgi:excisionase family DNA binding protein